MKKIFTSVLIVLIHGMTYAQSPGGATGMSLWVKANSGVTTSGSTVTAWGDQAGVNTFTVTGSPQLTAGAINFNPAVTFDGASRFTGNTSVSNITEALSVSKIVNSAGTNISGAVLGSVGAPSSEYFFHTEAGILYGSGSTTVYYGTTNFGNNVPWSVMDGDLSETPGTSQQMKVDGIAYANSVGGDPAPYTATPVIGGRGTENFISGSQVAEVVVYNSSQLGTNRSKIISYLGLKYGLTLGNNSSPVSYLASNGTVFWTGSSTYQTNVAGLGKDISSGLEQQISTSQDPTGDIITLSTDNNFTGASGTHTSIANDKFFFVEGNNGGSTAFASKTGLANGLNSIMGRVWLVQQTGTAQNVFISTSNKLATYLIYSTDPSFSTGVNYVALTSGATTGIQIPSGSYFTLATYLRYPGGVAGSQLWLEANNFGVSTADNTAVSTWSDISGNGNDATGYNSPAFRAGSNSTYALNFNPAIAFNGSNQYFQSVNGFANFTNGLSMFSVHQYATASSWARIFDFGNGAGVDNVLFARNSTNTYYTSETYNGTTSYPYVSTSAGSVYTGAYGITNWNQGPGAVGATVSSTINLKGTNNITSTSGVPSNTTRTLNYIGRSNWADTYFQGYMPEFILYNRQLSTAEQLQVHSYLSLKYGFTLNTAAGNPSNYVASDGATIYWNAATNSGYTKNVFGLGKDQFSSLEQQISASQDPIADIITLSTDNNFTGANGTHTSIANDKFFFLVANNGNYTSYKAQSGLSNKLNVIMNRSWKVQQTGTAQTLYLSTTNTAASYLIYSTDSTFSTGVNYIALVSGVASGVQAIPSGSYFTLAAYVKAPGGIAVPTTNGGYVNGVQYSLYNTNTYYPSTGMAGSVLSTGYANGFNGSNPPALAGSEIATYYGIQFNSSLKIRTAGSYTFELKRVDDNGALYIDGNLVVSTTGAGETDNTVGSAVTLSAGYHTVKLNYNQSYGGVVVEVQYQGPDNGNAMADMPDSVFFISPSIASWYKANGKITATGDGTTPTAWADETANANNTTASTGTATYYSATAAQLLNFNPVVNNTNRIFAGNDQSAGLAWGAQGRTSFTVTSGTSSTGNFLVIYNQGRYVTNNAYDIESNVQNPEVDFVNVYSGGSGTPFSNTNAAVLTRTSLADYNMTASASNNVSGYLYGISNYTATQTGFFTELDATADYGLGYMADGTGQNFPGRIAEVVNYPWPLSATESNKVETYLAIKYGTTLGNPTSLVNYTSTAGTIVWTGNATYQNNIIGLAKDTTEGLEQRISTSQMPAGDIITLSTDNSFTGANTTHAAIANDQFYFVVGNNGSNTAYTTKTGLSNGINAIMNRVWLVQQSGTAQNVFISTTNKQAGYLIYSTDATFSTGVNYVALTSGATAGTQIPSGNYFTLAAFIAAPGGVVNNLNAWFMSDSVSTVTVSGSNVSAWANSANPGFSFNLTNPNYSYGYVTYSSSSNLVNFNPGIYQNGSQTYGYNLYNSSTNVLTGLTAAATTGSSYSFITVGKDMGATASTLRSTFGNGYVGNDPTMDIQKDANSANGLNFYTDGVTGTGGSSTLGAYHAGEWYYYPGAYDAAPASNAQSNGTAYNNGGVGVLDYANAANLPSAYASRLANQQPQIYGANYTQSLTTGNPINAWLDGYKQNTYLTPGSGSVYMTYPELTVGNSGGGENWVGPINEVIAYNRELTDAEMQKVNTYLAIKYGVTLGQGGSTASNYRVGCDSNSYNYVSSAGTVIWNPVTNAGYNYDIFGIGRDDASGLQQKVSQSVNYGDVITVSTSSDFSSANRTSTRTTFSSDQSFFMVGNNGGPTTYTSKTGLSNGLNAMIGRVWMVQQTGTAQNVFFQTSSARATYLLYGSDPTFSTGVNYVALTSGATAGIQIPSGNYFTLAAFIAAPGGVVNNLNAWFMSDSVSTVTVSGSNVSAWANSANPGFSFNLTNPNYSYGYVTYSSSSNLVNFNPGIYQNGSQTYGYNLYNSSTNVLTGLTAAATTGSSYSFITVGKDMGATASTLRSTFGNGYVGNDPTMDIQKDANSANGLNFYTDGVTGTGGSSTLGAYHAGEWYYYPGTYDGAPSANAQSNGTAYNNGGAGVLDYANAANLPSAYASRLANQQPQIYGANYTQSLTTGNPINAWLDGYKQNTYLTPGSGSVYMTYPELTIGNSGGGENWVGPINEVIAYSRELTDVEMQKVNTYLAIKYGVTLGQGGSTASNYRVGCDSNSYNYVSSAGTVIWNPVTNAGYNYDIFGIGRDDASGLQQKVSQSVNYGDVVTVSTSSDFSSANRTSTRTTFSSDQSFLMVGNNGASAVMLQNTDVNLTLYRARVSRVWRVQSTNLSQNVNLQFTGWGTNTYRTVYLIKSTTGSFATGSTQLATLNASGQATGISFNNGDYFTLAVVQIAPGGVISGLQLWNEANSFAAGTADGTTITATWPDISGNAKDPVAYNSPVYHSGANSTYAANYNPAMTFNGTNQYFKAANGFADFTGGISMFSVHQYTSSSSWARIMDFGNGTNADNLLFARYGTTATYAAETYNGATQSANMTSTGTPAVYTNAYGLVSWIQTSGAVAAVANDTIYMKGIRNATSAALKVPNIISRTSNYIGLSNWAADSYFQGYVPEFVLYNRQLSALEQLRVNSYLALKYGFTLGSTSNLLSYTASDSLTVYWTGSSTYQNNVFGVGRDDMTGLAQVISKSSETGDIVTFALDNNFTVANNDATRTTAFANDKTFLVAGNDGGSVTTNQATNLPTSFCGVRLPRNWKIQRTNTIGAVNVQVNIGTALGSSLTAANLVLLIDQDGDGNFATGSQTAVYATSYSGGIAVFPGVYFDADNSGTDVFTIASRNFLPALVTLGSTLSPLAYCSSGSYNHYKNPLDATKSLIAFNTNGNSFSPNSLTVADLTTLTASGVANPTGNYYQQTTGANSVRVGNRFNSVVAPGSYTTNGGITVRVYYAAADTASMLTDAFPYSAILGDYGWYKASVSTDTAVVGNMQSATLLNANKIIPTAWGTENGINYVEFQVTSFSTFGYYAKTTNIVLSLNLDYFTGSASNCQAVLKWEAANETNLDHYEVEYSSDGISFQKIGQVELNGTGYTYQYTYSPPYSISYYRLKIVNNEGSSVYSNVVEVNTGCNQRKLVLSPNPAHSKVFVTALGSITIVDANLIDISGRLIMKVKDQLETGINVSSLAQGLYYIQVIEADGTVASLKFLKE